MAFKEDLKTKSAYIEDLLKQYMPKEEGYQKTIFEAMNYSLSSGGKRLRPILTLESAKIIGGDVKEVIPFCVAIEMIHTYSLIHDDLPAMDNDDFRRGKPTNHKVFGDGMATLAGDALLNYAFEIMLKESLGKENADVRLKAIYEIARGAGIYGMIGGQVVDIESENKSIEKEKLDFIYRLKTSALIEASMMIGSVLAGATGSEQKIVEAVASKVGLAFQIQDDILDVTSTMEVLGKPIGSDEKNHKSTYVTYEGIEKAKQDVADLSEKAIAQMETLVVKNEFLTELLRYLISREK